MEIKSPDHNKIKKKCACKGIRKCLLCDDNSKIDSDLKNQFQKTYIYCSECKNKAYDVEVFENHQNKHQWQTVFEDDDSSIIIDGVFLQTDVINNEEEFQLIDQIDSFEWIDSQSGRRKQDFGPRCNFKKLKINYSNFVGLPKLDVEMLDKIRKKRLKTSKDFKRFPKIIQNDNLEDSTVLNCFQPVEICHLEYCPERGSSIDPHFDDFWIWGERLVTLNLLSSTILTLTLPDSNEHCIRIFCPRKSIVVLYGEARHRYYHSIKRSDITSRRLAITYRELPNQFFDKNNTDKYALMEELMKRAKNLIEKPS